MLGKEESDDNIVDALLTGPEKEFFRKHELADLGKNHVKKDGMQLSFEWQFAIS